MQNWKATSSSSSLCTPESAPSLSATTACDYLSIRLGSENLIPVSASNAAGQPLFDLDNSNTHPLSVLGYADKCHLGCSLDAELQTFRGLAN